MEVVYERCCGLDVHKDTVVACLVVSRGAGLPLKETRNFGTMSADIEALAEWLASAGCTTVAMESTGVYWKPVYNLLEGSFELLLVNPAKIKALRRRKSDVRDAEWIADLLRHGMLIGSFVPSKEQRELRELTRYRTSLVRERAAEVNRLAKVLEGANIKLRSVASSLDTVSARAMLEELVAGREDAPAIAELARGRMREKIPELERALAGKFGGHQRFLVAEQLAHLDYLEGTIERVSAQIAERMRPFEEAIAHLDTIPGVGREMAETIVAEIGTDMSRFPTGGHLASWAGLSPNNEQSAGKAKAGKTLKGNRTLRSILTQAAHAAARSKKTYLAAQYYRLVPRRGKARAAVAVAHSILVIAYHLLVRNEDYRDLGALYFAQRDPDRVRRAALRQLQALGYKVTLEMQDGPTTAEGKPKFPVGEAA